MTVNLARLDEYPVVAVDIESSGLHWYRDKMFGVAVAVQDGDGTQSGYWDIREQPRVMDALREQLPRVRRMVNHNIKFDCHFLMNEGVQVPLDRIECTMVRAALINENELSFSLDALCKKYIGEGKVDIWGELAKLFGGASTRAVQISNLHRAPSSLTARYAAPDPALALRLWLWQEEEIKKQGLQQVWDLERRVTPVLVQIERQGVRVDVERAKKSMVDVDRLVAHAQKELNRVAGFEVNANSPVQMRKLLRVHKETDGRWYAGTRILETTDGGEASISADVLRSLAAQGDARAQTALNIRKLIKAKSFLKDHILGHEVRGRVHPNFNQARGESGLGTSTGRFSVNDPALQQIPSRDVEIAAIVRSCFIPEPKHKWFCIDWSQFEQRWFGHYAQDPTMLAKFKDDPKADFYQVVSDLTGIPRNPQRAGGVNSKQLVLGLIFGMSTGRMASEIGLPYTVQQGKDGREYLEPGDEARELMTKLYGAIPGIRNFLDQASSIAKARGYVKTIMGRHIRFPHGRFTHKAGGLVLQGSAADAMKVKMVEISEMLRGTGAAMLLSVHDEIDIDLSAENIRELTERISVMYTKFDGDDTPIKCRVPIICSSRAAENWHEASKK